MTMDTPDFKSPNCSVSLRLAIPGSNGKFANEKSYLKPRRSAAKQERRGEILGRLDSSLNDVNFELPRVPSDHVFVPPRSLSQSLHKKTKRREKLNMAPASFHGCSGSSLSSSSHSDSSKNRSLNPAEIEDDIDQNAPMDEVLRSLHCSGLTDNDATGCTEMMSSGSFCLNFSSQHTSSFASLFSDEDFSSPTTGIEGEECAGGENKAVRDECSKPCAGGNTADLVSLSAHDDERLEDNETDASYYEEEIVFSDDETIEEEVSLGDEEGMCWDEHIVEGMKIVSEDDQYTYYEEEYYSDEEEIVEIVLDDFADVFAENGVDERNRFEASLDKIVEEEYDSECISSEGSNIVFVEEDCRDGGECENESLLYHEPLSFEEFIEEMIIGDDYGAFVEGDLYELIDDDESYIEEEIIPRFDVPCVQAIVEWQEQEALRAALEEKEPPEIATRTPRNILMAVLAAAALDFKLRKVPDDHKRRFEPLADTAACLGRLTKLQERTVEATGRAQPVKSDDWSPTGAPIRLERSLNLRLCTEAAAMGRIMRLREKVVTNYEEPNMCFSDESKTDIDELLDDKGRPIFRTSVLVPLHELDAKHESLSRDWNLGILEAVEAEEISLQNVKLPTEQIPRFNRPASCSPVMSRQEINDAIARGVAEGAWNRKYRLDRPQVKLRITSRCNCRYCENPNPFQTHAYKELLSSTSKCSRHKKEAAPAVGQSYALLP